MPHYAPLCLYVPEPTGRPGHDTDFSYLPLSNAGAVRRPPVDVLAAQTSELAFTLIRVLDQEGNAVGPWAPEVDANWLRKGLHRCIGTGQRVFAIDRDGRLPGGCGCHQPRASHPGRGGAGGRAACAGACAACVVVVWRAACASACCRIGGAPTLWALADTRSRLGPNDGHGRIGNDAPLPGAQIEASRTA